MQHQSGCLSFEGNRPLTEAMWGSLLYNQPVEEEPADLQTPEPRTKEQSATGVQEGAQGKQHEGCFRTRGHFICEQTSLLLQMLP